MGLVTALLTLPLLPLRATIALAEQIRQQAERELHDPVEVRRQLDEVEQLRRSGLMSEDEANELEEILIERLVHRPGS